MQGLFLSYRKLRSYTIKKRSAKDAHSREEEICRKRPRWLREFRKRNSLFFARKFLFLIQA